MPAAPAQLRDNSKRVPAPYRAWRRLRLSVVRALHPFLPQQTYMRWLTATLRDFGMNVSGQPVYIAPRCWFDGTDFSAITIEDQVVISKDVNILTHDFSLARARDALAQQRRLPEVVLIRNVHIGRNSFVGLGSILMPGVNIGANCIIGAGSVVRGDIPDNSIVLGNPAAVIGNTLEWGARKLREQGIDP